MKNFKAMGAAKTRKQSGFTIIELVVVILLLGILTATALPRFLDISTEAHDAVVDAVEGGVRTGSALFRAHWFAESQPTGVVGSATEWNNMKADASVGYPAGTSTGVDGALIDLSTECEVVMVGLLQGGAPVVGNTFDDSTLNTSDTVAYTVVDADIAEANASGIDFLANMSVANSTCQFFYTADGTRQTASGVPLLTYVATAGSWARAN